MDVRRAALKLGCCEGTVRKYMKKFNVMILDDRELEKIRETMQDFNRQHAVGHPWGKYL